MGTSAVTETLPPVEEGQLYRASLERLWTLRDSVLVICLNGDNVARGHQGQALEATHHLAAPVRKQRVTNAPLGIQSMK